MTNEELIKLIDKLRELPKENEWVEFKHNKGTATNEKIGKYISGIANAACLANEAYGYLVWGIENETHQVLGTTFRFKQAIQGNQELELWLRTLIFPKIKFLYFSIDYNGKYLELLKIPGSKGQPTHFKKIPYIRFNSSLVNLRNFPEHIKAIYNSKEDWSAKIIGEANINDLDKEAIKLAKSKFKEKESAKPYYDQIDSWNTATFLDKAKITIDGQITTTALILLVP